MLRSEKLEAGPLMSLNGSFQRFFRYKPLWLKLTVIPVAWFFWVMFVCPLYYMFFWAFYRHGVQRQKLVDRARHQELLDAQRNNTWLS